jgi:hypothetical protein
VAALSRRCHEEALVKGFSQTPPPPAGINADEVAVNLVRVGLRAEARQESDDRFVMNRDIRPRAKVGKEETWQHASHLAPAPPNVNAGDDPIEVV